MTRRSDASSTTCVRCDADVPAGAMFCGNCGANLASGRAVGPVIPGYTILDVLGRGGAAVVYRAHQAVLDREVAIKVLRHDVDDSRVWRNFQREARTIARLSGHANVVNVYDAGRTDTAEPYLVTEYLDRGSLGDIVRNEGPLAAPEVVAVGLAVADALLAVHEVGILHRDVKPENVLLGRDGRVKLGDFGIAQLLAGRVESTTNVIAFTPEHVAPEILGGGAAGPWTDVYGLASTLASALLGRSLFARSADESIPELLSRKLAAPAPSLPDIVPASLAQALAAALDPEPSRRPSLAEFRSRLSAASESMDDTTPLPNQATQPVVATGPRHGPANDPVRITAAVAGSTVPSGQRNPTLFDDLKEERRRRHVVGWLVGTGLALLLVSLAALLVRRGGDEQAGATTAPVAATASFPDSTVPTPAVTSAVPPTTPANTTASSPPATSTISTVAVVPTTPTTSLAPAPSTTAATNAAPTTAAPTTVTPTVIPVANPPAQQGAPSVISPAEAEGALRAYYDLVESGDYETSWSQLAPSFQRGKARSFEYYADFWDENDIEVGEVRFVDADQGSAVVQADLRWNGGTSTVTDEFTLVRGDDGQLRILEQKSAKQ